MADNSNAILNSLKEALLHTTESIYNKAIIDYFLTGFVGSFGVRNGVAGGGGRPPPAMNFTFNIFISFQY
jgi:hypothetical protein